MNKKLAIALLVVVIIIGAVLYYALVLESPASNAVTSASPAASTQSGVSTPSGTTLVALGAEEPDVSLLAEVGLDFGRVDSGDVYFESYDGKITPQGDQEQKSYLISGASAATINWFEPKYHNPQVGNVQDSYREYEGFYSDKNNLYFVQTDVVGWGMINSEENGDEVPYLDPIKKTSLLLITDGDPASFVIDGATRIGDIGSSNAPAKTLAGYIETTAHDKNQSYVVKRQVFNCSAGECLGATTFSITPRGT